MGGHKIQINKSKGTDTPELLKVGMVTQATGKTPGTSVAPQTPCVDNDQIFKTTDLHI